MSRAITGGNKVTGLKLYCKKCSQQIIGQTVTEHYREKHNKTRGTTQ